MKPWDVPLDAASLGWLGEAWGQDLQSWGLILQGLLELRGDKVLRAAQRPPPPPNRQLGFGTELILGQAAEPLWAPPHPPLGLLSASLSKRTARVLVPRLVLPCLRTFTPVGLATRSAPSQASSFPSRRTQRSP